MKSSWEMSSILCRKNEVGLMVLLIAQTLPLECSMLHNFEVDVKYYPYILRSLHTTDGTIMSSTVVGTYTDYRELCSIKPASG